MYSSLPNQLFNIIHLILSFYLLFVLYPKFVLKPSYETKFEDVISNYILMVFLFILLGYLLVLIKLYEFIGITLSLFGIFIYSYLRRRKGDEIEATKLVFISLIFNYADKGRSIKADLKNLVKVKNEKLQGTLVKGFKNKIAVWNVVMLLITLGYSSYLRLYDAFVNAAPAMADSYTTLKWMKFINNRILFPDGIYPQGFHIYLATLQKFAFIDPLYILKYVGPINCVFIALGIYFVLSRITENKTAGVVGAIVYGILISFMVNDLARQAATNSQEFGYLFVIPTLYFLAKYISSNRKKDFITALSGVAITALVHTISFAFIAIGVVILIIIAMLINFKKYWRRISSVVGIGLFSGFVGILPVGIGLLLKKGLNSSSQSFLTEKASVIGFHILSKMDYIGLMCILIIFIYLLFNFKKIEENILYVFILILNIVSFLIYYLGGNFTQNAVIATRFIDLWCLTLPLIIGMGFYVVISLLKNIKIRNVLTVGSCMGFILFCAFYINPKPIIPYKMEYNSNVEQYLKISKMFIPTDWMIVSQQEGYAVVMGKGYHLMMGDFLENFSPASKDLIDKSSNIIVKTPDIFLYQEKNVFLTTFTKEIDYPLRKVQDEQLQTWVDKYKETHSNLSIFYEDKNIKIYRIHQQLTDDEVQSKIWGINWRLLKI